MSFTLTNSANYVSTASSTSHTLTFGFTATTGRLLVVWFGVNQTSLPTGSAGWLRVGAASTTNQSLGWWIKVSDGTETNFVLTTSSVAAVMSVEEYTTSGFPALTWISDANNAAATSTTTVGSVDTRPIHQSDSLVLAGYMNIGANTYSGARLATVNTSASTGSTPNVNFLFGREIRVASQKMPFVDYRATQSSTTSCLQAYLTLRGSYPSNLPSVAQSVGYTESGTAGTSHQKTGITTTAGRQIVIAIAHSGAATDVSSVVDSAGNSYGRLRATTIAGACIDVWATTDDNPSAISGGSITVTTGSAKGVAFRMFELLNVGPSQYPFESNLAGTAFGLSTTTSGLTSVASASAGQNQHYSIALSASAGNAVGRTWSSPSWSTVVDGTTQSGTTAQDESNVTSNPVTLYTSYIMIPGGANGSTGTPLFSVTLNTNTNVATQSGFLPYSPRDDRSDGDEGNDFLRPSFTRKLEFGYEWRVQDPYSTVPVEGQLWPRGSPRATTQP